MPSSDKSDAIASDELFNKIIMTKKQSLLYLFLPLIAGISSLHAAVHDVLSEVEGKNESHEIAYQQPPRQKVDKNHFYDYTLQNSKKEVDHTIDPDDLDDEKQDFIETSSGIENRPVLL